MIPCVRQCKYGATLARDSLEHDVAHKRTLKQFSLIRMLRRLVLRSRAASVQMTWKVDYSTSFTRNGGSTHSIVVTLGDYWRANTLRRFRGERWAGRAKCALYSFHGPPCKSALGRRGRRAPPEWASGGGRAALPMPIRRRGRRHRCAQHSAVDDSRRQPRPTVYPTFTSRNRFKWIQRC